MVVPLGKRWEANQVRVQIVQRERVIQMVVFFADFAHGKCMNFQLKKTDSYESFGKSGKFYVRLVDAKFALPKADGTAMAEFLCLDNPDFPTEHDDINLAFDSEAGKPAWLPGCTLYSHADSDRAESERLQKVLPAPVNKLSRMALLTR
jgi:hypothetical protein